MTDEEIRIAIVEKVMEWESARVWDETHCTDCDPRGDGLRDFDSFHDDADACIVLDRMAELGLEPKLITGGAHWSLQWWRAATADYGMHSEPALGCTPAGRRRTLTVGAVKAVGAWKE